MPASPTPTRPASGATPAPLAPARLSGLRGLWPFVRPHAGALALAGLFLALAAAATLAFPLALRGLIDGGALAPGADRGALQRAFGTLFGVAVAVAVFSAARFFTVSWLGERVTTDLRNAVYAQVLRQSPAFFEATPSGEVLSRLSADATLVQSVVGSSFSMGLRNAVTGLGALAMLVWTHPWVMVQVLALLGAVVLPAMAMGRHVRRLSRASQDRLADATALAAEVLAAMPVVQAHDAQTREAARFAQASERGFATALRRSGARALLLLFIVIGNAALMLWGLYAGAVAVAEGRMSAGQLGQTALYVVILAGAVTVLGEVYGEWLRAAGATERLMELLHQQPAIASPAQPLPVPDASAGLTIDFDALRLAYPSRPQASALDGFDLHIAAGETVALVGASGAGKSSVLAVLQRFYEPQAGQVRLGGVPVERLSLGALRGCIATVPQEAVIFSASARENIRYGRPDASDAEVEHAARQVGLHTLIAALPQGYDSPLGERGVRLSGGQRQRLAIARALLRNAPVLLLDEATSALDAESEHAVQQALDAALRPSGGARRTTLIIAHRLATVQKADRIVVMAHGRVIEQGSHASLIAAGGTYARLAALQFMA